MPLNHTRGCDSNGGKKVFSGIINGIDLCSLANIEVAYEAMMVVEEAFAEHMFVTGRLMVFDAGLH